MGGPVCERRGVKRIELASAAGASAALAAVIASPCCALPMALVFAGVSTGVVGLLAPLHAVRPLILIVAGASLLAGWIVAARRGSRGSYALLSLGTALFVFAFFWQTWDPLLQHLVMRSAAP
jgi:hypothetical protein